MQPGLAQLALIPTVSCPGLQGSLFWGSLVGPGRAVGPGGAAGPGGGSVGLWAC